MAFQVSSAYLDLGIQRRRGRASVDRDVNSPSFKVLWRVLSRDDGDDDGDGDDAARSTRVLAEVPFHFANGFLHVFRRPFFDVGRTVSIMQSHLPVDVADFETARLHSRIHDAASAFSRLARSMELEVEFEVPKGYELVAIYEEHVRLRDAPREEEMAAVHTTRHDDDGYGGEEFLLEDGGGGARRPASREYVEGLERVRYDDGTTTAMRETGCVICMEEFGEGEEVVSLECSHAFHGVCMEEWMERNHVCPLCRFEMPREEVVMHVGVDPFCVHRIVD